MPCKIAVGAEKLLTIRAGSLVLTQNLVILVVKPSHAAAVWVGALLEQAILHDSLVLLNDEELFEQLFATDGFHFLT